MYFPLKRKLFPPVELSPQKGVIEIITVKVSELLKMAQELTNDGIEYVELEEREADEDFPKNLSFTGYGGVGDAIDYEEINHVEVSWDYKFEQEDSEP